MIKAKGIVNASPAAVHRLFEDNTRVNEYNDFFERGVDLEEVAENTKVGCSFSLTQLIFSEPVFYLTEGGVGFRESNISVQTARLLHNRPLSRAKGRHDCRSEHSYGALPGSRHQQIRSRFNHPCGEYYPAHRKRPK